MDINRNVGIFIRYIFNQRKVQSSQMIICKNLFNAKVYSAPLTLIINVEMFCKEVSLYKYKCYTRDIIKNYTIKDSAIKDYNNPVFLQTHVRLVTLRMIPWKD